MRRAAHALGVAAATVLLAAWAVSTVLMLAAFVKGGPLW